MFEKEAFGGYRSSVLLRMRLKRVRLFGFKTFADRTEFSLEGGLIAVVGPNGCGKSNLVDAILWGLGEGNARQLRAANSQDVIFNGSAKRKAVGFAEVNLLFDNEDGALPIDTAEVTITRKLARNGDSEYSINRRTCRLKDVYDLLADSGLGRAGYAIVGQKEIDAALSASAEDRRAWLDEAAGVQRYRARKIESLRRLSQAQDHLARVDDILRELESQREPLKEEAAVAARYKNLVAALRDVELGLLVSEVVAAVREVNDLERGIEESLRKTQAELARAERLEAEAREVAAEVSELEAEMDAVRAIQQGSLTALERAEAAIRLARQRLESLDEAERSLEEDADASRARLAEASSELERVRAEEAAEREAREALRTEFAGAGEEAKRLTTTLRECETELVRAREIHAKRLKAEAEAAHRDDRRALVEREIAGIDDGMPDLHEAVAQAQEALTAAVEAASQKQEQIREAEAKDTAVRVEEDRDAQSVRRALAERASLEGRRRGIEATIDAHEGLTQGSRAVMEAAERGLLKAEYVAVGQAVEADKELALAIETALGGSANDLIVEREADAKAAIAWLKEHRAGRATFQPIPLMRPFEPSYELRRLLGELGVIGRASELVRTAPKHRPVIDSLLGRVVVVEDIDTALRHAKTSGWSRMVTLDGEVVHSSGAVTGGQQTRQTYGMVQRRADLVELEREIATLGKSVSEFESRSTRRTRQREEIAEEMRKLREAAVVAQREVQEARSYLATLVDEIKSATRSRDKLTAELHNLNQVRQTLPAVDLDEIEARRDTALRAVAAQSADAEQAEARLRDAESRLQQARERREAAERRLNAAKDAESTRARRLAHLEPDRLRHRAEISAQESEAVKAKKAKGEAESRLAAMQEQRRHRLEESLRLTEEAKHARDNAASIGDGAHQAELNRARAEARRANALARLAEDYGIGEEEALEQEGVHAVPGDATSVVNRLRREIRSMGDVNLGAIEAFDRLTQRIEDLGGQRDDVVEGIRHVEASIQELDKLTRDRFLMTFDAVQRAFSERFQQLFGGGEGKLSLTDPGKVLETGIEVDVQLPGKKRQALNLLSGGERSLCASAFLFALLTVKPSPLVVLDEVDAPLDGRNVERFAGALRELTDRTQFIVITHNESTIGAADKMLGVTMQEPGVSMLLPQRLPSAAG